jgi:hypothetical protein
MGMPCAATGWLQQPVAASVLNAKQGLWYVQHNTQHIDQTNEARPTYDDVLRSTANSDKTALGLDKLVTALFAAARPCPTLSCSVSETANMRAKWRKKRMRRLKVRTQA